MKNTRKVMMKGMIFPLVVVGVVGLCLGVAAPEAEAICPPDSVLSGFGCIDKYEASVWDLTGVSPAVKPGLVKKIKTGTVTLANLTAAGAIQRGVSSDDYGAGCPDTGNECLDFYAVSIAGVLPSTFITWFQAVAAARNSNKRLPTSAEWTAAALGTPDPGTDDGSTDCNILWEVPIPGPGDPVPTGSRSKCVSDVGAFDMVGNLSERVADWVPRASSCDSWPAGFGDDVACMDGAADDGVPAALIRGGNFTFGVSAGVFTVQGNIRATEEGPQFTGFRATR